MSTVFFRRSAIVVLGLALLAAACVPGDPPDEVASEDSELSSETAAPSTTEVAAVDAEGAEGDEGDDAGEGDVADESADADAAGGDVVWSPCEGFECSTLLVPLDHNDPTGTQIDIAVVRQPATGLAADRIGSVIFNPGGPGGSGVEFLQRAALTIPAEVAARFDLVSFDPRGVGASSAVDCDLDLDDAITLVPEGDDQAWNDFLTEEEALLGTCPAEAIQLAPYVGTNNAARDLDLLRAALGDEKLTFVGYSYGTRLGATYAELFPQNVRALVLDAGVEPTDDGAALDLAQAKGFDLAFENFAAACDADTDCLISAIGPTIDVFRSIETEILELGSLETDGDRVLTAGEFYLGVLAALYSVDAWPFLDQALFTAETLGDGTLLQVLGDNLADRQPDGTYSNSNEANTFINCADDPRRVSADEVRSQAVASAAQSQYFSNLFRGTASCLFTPDPIDPIAIGPATGAAPILVLGNLGDPATPYEWSVSLAESLDSGVLYTLDAEGHTAYGSFQCVEATVNAYLIDLVVPEEGSSCSENATADFFPPTGDSDVDQVIAFFDCLAEEGLDVGEVTTADVLGDPTGEKLFEGIDLNSPDTQEAFLACQSLLPTG